MFEHRRRERLIMRAGALSGGGSVTHDHGARAHDERSFAAACGRTRCRSCGALGLAPVLDLGTMPLVDRLPTPHTPPPDDRYPLAVGLCGACSLVQLLETVPPDRLFDADYPYYSSVSASYLAHARFHAERLIAERALDGTSLVIEIASNDGYMLSTFVEHDIPVLGIDPADGPVHAARRRGVTTHHGFFDGACARGLQATGVAADVVVGNNVLAHVPELNDFVDGVRQVLKPGGIAVFEVPYLRSLVDGCEFDTIYHEHVHYFSVAALDALFDRHGLALNDVELLPVHGGSLRVRVAHEGARTARLESLLVEEQRIGLHAPEYFADFAPRVRTLVDTLRSLLAELRAGGARVAAYGAAAKGVVFLNAAGLGPDLIDFVADRNPKKHGRLVPGVRLPIVEPARLLRDAPAFTVLLAWNLREEILDQQREYRRRGGRFIVPAPSPAIF